MSHEMNISPSTPIKSENSVASLPLHAHVGLEDKGNGADPRASEINCAASLESQLDDFDLSGRTRPKSSDSRRTVSALALAVSRHIPGLRHMSSFFSSISSVSASSSSPRLMAVRFSGPSPAPTTPPRPKLLKKRRSNDPGKRKESTRSDQPDAKPQHVSSKRKEKESMDQARLGNNVFRRDLLPTDKKGLESRMNYHLAELDRLREQISYFNAIILDNCKHLSNIHTRPDVIAGNMRLSLAFLEAQYEGSIHCRDSLIQAVEYHREELSRCVEWGVKLRERNGEERPNVWVRDELGGDAKDWQRLFSVGRDLGKP